MNEIERRLSKRIDGVYDDISANADDIASGTWTPALIGDSVDGTWTFTEQTGNYVRIGNLVWFQARITWSAMSSANGRLQLTGLPFSAARSFMTAAVIPSNINFYTSGATCMQTYTVSDESYLRFHATGDDIAATVMYAQNVINSTGGITLTGMYETS